MRLAHGSATDLRAALDAADASYDAVFDVGVLHHVPNWRDANHKLREETSGSTTNSPSPSGNCATDAERSLPTSPSHAKRLCG